MAQTKASLIYVGDPMCSWCYGFSEELNNVVDRFNGELELKMVMGGLRPYNEETMSDLSDFLSHHWKEVAEESGQIFNYNILRNEEYLYDTEPPSRAVIIVRELNPDKELSFFNAVQQAFYKDNKNTNEMSTYIEIGESIGLDTSAFQAMYLSDEWKENIRQEFEEAADLGVFSFPSLILDTGEKKVLLTQGYQKSDFLIHLIEQLIEDK